MSSSASCTCCDAGYREHRRSGSLTIIAKNLMANTRDKIAILQPEFLVFSK
ncbi:hypothetical protein SAMN02927921_02395 [Sinomicrobium oceani]|uniref:Uncharacterized protein n=1 Tax=Sinomicrobium oceani TaxID=1150368 RepID=A0A1K1QB70_9FLAO|nr:hypothetical protein [Sinomicrobium oceani]SFW56953.1 hypothetical protein SAMN02927921_02395 [Sinomicrobium oceani]